MVPVGFTNSYLVEKDGTDGGVIVVFKDLSDIRKLHEQLREREHFSAIGKVAAGVAHEIRNPLFGITSVAQILGREIKDDTPQKALIDAMLSETSRLNTLVEDMLLYGRSTKLSPQPVDLNELIEGVVRFHQGGITEKGLKILNNFDKELPQLMLDQGQMKQVFLNLLVNAVDASVTGGEIIVRTGVKGESAVIEIADNGVGIPVDDVPKVFDLFYTTKEKGTGLGLAICRKIVEDHGGTVTISSMPGKGTSIRIRPTVTGGQGQRLNRTLLIIDDEKSVRQSLRYMFKNKGYDIHEAGNAAEGVAAAKAVQPDLAILDYRLPDKTGLDALAEYKGRRPRLPCHHADRLREHPGRGCSDEKRRLRLPDQTRRHRHA